MDSNFYTQINKFMNEIVGFYPNIEMEITDYNSDDGDSAVILHNYANWADDNDNFGEITYELFKKYFRDNDFLDVGFSFSFTLPTYIEQDTLVDIETINSKVTLNTSNIFKGFQPVFSNKDCNCITFAA